MVPFQIERGAIVGRYPGGGIPKRPPGWGLPARLFDRPDRGYPVGMADLAADRPPGGPAAAPQEPAALPEPGSIRPMLAVIGDLPEDESRWATEIKWDGVRALAWCRAGEARLFGRNGTELTARFPEVAPLGLQAVGRSFVLDGELVMFNREGRPDFELIQGRLGGPPPLRRIDRSAAYMIFDLLDLDGEDLRRRPWAERRARLEALELGGDRWQVPPVEAGGASELFAATGIEGLEGVVLKRLDSPYRAGRRHPDWRKVKHVLRHEFVVGGWLPGRGNREGRVGALLLGHFERGELVYDGRVGSGLAEADLDRADRALAPLEAPEPPFAEAPPDLPSPRFVRPVLVVEVEYHRRTTGGLLRHPVFRGWRHDKPAAEVGPE